jgi:hypoxanthine phosphoribosyltransferase
MSCGSLLGIGEILVDEATIRGDVERLGARISADYAGRQPHLIGVLKGAAVFIADLMRALSVPATVDFIAVAPYDAVTASGVVHIRKDLDEPIEARDVILVEGLCSSGRVLAYLLRNFETRRPASLRVCALLVKARPRLPGVTVHYAGREIPDVLVAGYGLALDERYRNLPYVARLA